MAAPMPGKGLTLSLSMTSFIILFWLTPDDFTRQCGRRVRESVQEDHLNNPLYDKLPGALHLTKIVIRYTE